MKGPLKQQKRSGYATPSTKKYNSSQGNISGLQRSLFLHKRSDYRNSYTNNKPITTPQSRGEPIFQEDEEFQHQSMSQKTMIVLNQLNLSALYAYCMNFQEKITELMNSTLATILGLQLKMAQLMKKFYTIEMRLHQKSKEIKTLIEENCVLIQLNRDVEIRMEQLRDKYQVSCQTVKSQWMANVVDEIKTQIKKYDVQSKICEGCRAGIKENLSKYLSKINSLTTQAEKSSFHSEQPGGSVQTIKSSLKEMILLILSVTEGRQDIAFQAMKQKTLENIDLKFTLIEFQEKLKNLKKEKQNAEKNKNGKQSQRKQSNNGKANS